eukprot:3274417-Rhodomonas_salina.2
MTLPLAAETGAALMVTMVRFMGAVAPFMLTALPFMGAEVQYMACGAVYGERGCAHAGRRQTCCVSPLLRSSHTHPLSSAPPRAHIACAAPY